MFLLKKRFLLTSSLLWCTTVSWSHLPKKKLFSHPPVELPSHIQETSIPDEQQNSPPNTEKTTTLQNPTSKTPQTISSDTPAPPQITTKTKDLLSAREEDDFGELKVLDEYQKILQNAEIHIGKSSSGITRYFGVTDNSGKLKIPYSRELLGDILIVRHTCCKTLVIPLPFSQKNIFVTLNSGRSIDVYALQNAYGVKRGIEGVHLKNGNAKLSATNSLGFTSYPIQQNFNLPWSLEFEEKANKKTHNFLPTDFEHINVIHLTPDVTPLARMGWIEDETITHNTSPFWHKFRRDFYSRFIQTPAWRAVIQSDVLKMLSWTKTTLDHIHKKGWQQSLLNEELDFLLEWSAPPASTKNKATFLLHLYNRQGKILFEKTCAPASEPAYPEQSAQITFTELNQKFEDANKAKVTTKD